MYYSALQLQPLRIPAEDADFILAFRDRMTKISYLTRFYIVQRIAGIGNVNAVMDELLKMPDVFKQLGESIGVSVPDEIIDLLTQFESRLQELVDSMLSGDQAKADESIRKLYQLADEIAADLAQFNPYYNKDVLANYLRTNFKEVIDEVIAIKTNDYNKALDIFDRMVYTAVDLGDYYAQGLLDMAPKTSETNESGTISLGQLNIIKDFRLIMTQFAYLSRFYMVARILGLFEADYLSQRLYALPVNLHEKTEMILGFFNSEGLLNLLSVYAIKLETIINAVLSGDPAVIEAAMNDLYRYADQIAEYLASINPYWTKSKWKELLYAYNNHLIDEITALQSEGLEQTEEYEASLPIFEEMLQAALDIADYLAQGMIQYAFANETSPTVQRVGRQK